MTHPNRFLTHRLLPGLVASLALAAAPSPLTAQGGQFTKDFFLDQCTFDTKGENLFFILQPGYRLILAGEEDGEEVQVVITVTDRTRWIGGVETRVVLERETADGELVEISRNFIALCRETQSIIYFGEEVDIYEDGKVVSHDGAWLAGENGNLPGILMPGQPLLGAKYFQEIAAGVALDRAEIVSLNEVLTTPLGTFRRLLKTVETTTLEPGHKSIKYYALGLGLISDGPAVLVFAGYVN